MKEKTASALKKIGRTAGRTAMDVARMKLREQAGTPGTFVNRAFTKLSPASARQQKKVKKAQQKKQKELTKQVAAAGFVFALAVGILSRIAWKKA